jgi:hypothetical protein
MNPPRSNTLTLTLAALATAAFLPSAEAQFPDAPPVPSLAPKAGMTTELFNGVKLAQRPAPGAKVEGWYPISIYSFEKGRLDEMDLIESPPELFDAPAGVLRFYSVSDYRPYGRAKQVPASTEVSVDLYLDSNYLDGQTQFGLFGNLLDGWGAEYGVIVGNFGFCDCGDGSEVEESSYGNWFVAGNDFFQPIEGDLSDQWLRLEIKINKEANTVTYLVNGEVVFSGTPREIKGIRTVDDLVAEVSSITEVALIHGFGGVSSEPESQPDVEEARYGAFAFFDNLSHNGASGAADLTVGGKRPSASHVGNNVYGPVGKQVATIEQSYNLKASAWFSLQNDGTSADEISVRGSASGSSQVKVKTYAFKGSKRVNVTGSVAAGNFKSALDPGKEITLLSEAKLAGRGKKYLARKRGAVLSRSQTLAATSSGNADGGDSVKASFNFNSAIPLSRPGY